MLISGQERPFEEYDVIYIIITCFRGWMSILKVYTERGTVSLTTLRSYWGSEGIHTNMSYEEKDSQMHVRLRIRQQPWPLCFYMLSVHKTFSKTTDCVFYIVVRLLFSTCKNKNRWKYTHIKISMGKRHMLSITKNLRYLQTIKLN